MRSHSKETALLIKMSKLVLLLVILAALHSSAQQARCVGLSKYFFPNFKANWFKANEYCNYLGMRLAIISSREDQAKLVEVLKSTDRFSESWTAVWIGASDLAEEGNFHWVATGTKVGKYSKWKSPQPDNGRGVEHCVEIRYSPSAGWDWDWNDLECSDRKYFACENAEQGREIVLF